MCRVLITGAGGFVGRHCLGPLVKRGFEVHALSSSGKYIPQSGVVWHRDDLLESNCVRPLLAKIKPSHLMHLAWVTDPQTYRQSTANLAWVEVSMQLVREFYECGGRRAVLTGSCAEYDWNYGLCREYETPLRPATLYGTCKAALYSAFEQHVLDHHLDGAWARLFFLYGPHAPMTKIPGVVIEAVEKGAVIKCSHGNQLRDFMYVLDAADALVELLASDLQGAVNVATGQALRVNEMIAAVTDYCGGHRLVQLGARRTGEHEPPLVVADSTRLNRELNWAPKFGYREALVETIQWWRENETQLVR
ncbi:MAG: NAD(P)-dependent oxidoreductase [Candidatus Paceibacterota bacterium]